MKLLLSAISLTLLAWTPLPQATSTPVPLVLPQPLEGFGRHARAASDGRGFYVTSNEYGRARNPNFSGYNFQYGTAFDGLGHPLQADISHSAGLGTGLAAVASSGANYLVVWYDGDGGRLYARRVSGEGRPIDSAPLLVHDFRIEEPFAPPSLDYSAAWDGTRYIVAFEKPRGLHGMRVVTETGEVSATELGAAGSEVAANRNGTILFATHQADEITEEQALIVESLNVGPVQIGEGSQAVLAAGSGDEFLIAYHFSGDVWVRRLDRVAQPLGDAVMISNRSTDPSVTWNGDHWLVAFTKGGQTPSVQGVRVTSASAGAPFLIAANASLPAVASNGSRVLVSWLRGDGVREKAMLDGETVSETGPLNRQLAAASVAGMAAMGDTTVIGQTRNAIYGEVDVWAARGGAVTHIRTISGPVRFEAVGASDSHALVVVSTQNDVELRFYILDGAGNVLAESEQELASAPRNAAVYWLGSHYLVTWNQDIPNAGTEGFSITVGADGALGRRRFIPVTARVARAAAADRTLTVFSQSGSAYGGTIEGPGGASISIAADSDTTQTSPIAVATDGQGFLVAYTNADRQIRVQRIEFDGKRGTDRILPPDESSFSRHTLGWTGEYFVMLRWRPGNPIVDALRLEPDGRLIDRDFVPLHTIPALRYGNIPALLVRDSNQIEIVSGTPPEPFGSPGKTWLRLGSGGTRRRAAGR